MLGLKDKSVIVTGGGSGIGRATALLLGQAEAAVTVADWNAESAADTAAMIVNAGGRAQSVTADVRDEYQAAEITARALAAYGRLDCAANCAGVPQHSLLLHELSLAQWRTCIEINLTGVFLCMKYQIQAMLERATGGSIVNVSSSSAVRGFPRATEYAASKAGLLALTRDAAYEYGKLGIRVNSVIPGATDTPMLRDKMRDTPGLEEMIAGQHMLGRFAAAGEVGIAIRWLLSDEASFVTGANIPVDGGHTAS